MKPRLMDPSSDGGSPEGNPCAAINHPDKILEDQHQAKGEEHDIEGGRL